MMEQIAKQEKEAAADERGRSPGGASMRSSKFVYSLLPSSHHLTNETFTIPKISSASPIHTALLTNLTTHC